MFTSFLSHLICAWFAFALPAYATYKAVAHESASPESLQALATYWVVIGAFLAFEQTLGLVLSWLPFYWELRTIFLLYVALPQTDGSGYVYKTLLEPWFAKNEADLDVAMASAQTNTIAFCRTRVTAFLDLVWNALNKIPTSTQPSSAGDPQKPAGIMDLWSTYGPSVIAAFAPKDASGAHVTTVPQHQPYSTN